MTQNNYKRFNISDTIVALADQAEAAVSGAFSGIEKVREYNQLKVIAAMQSQRLSDTHFSGTTGYGYNDRGREVLDAFMPRPSEQRTPLCATA
jgi:cystathionine beta-lyase family protein involved in aluminum resistance